MFNSMQIQIYKNIFKDRVTHHLIVSQFVDDHFIWNSFWKNIGRMQQKSPSSDRNFETLFDSEKKLSFWLRSGASIGITGSRRAFLNCL